LIASQDKGKIMLRSMLKSKIHRATVTETNLQYEGSITVDAKLLKAADILPNEKVQVVNISNGSRLETYVMPGRAGGGTICMNGAAARWAEPGDLVIIIAYCLIDDAEAAAHVPVVVRVDPKNRILPEA